MNRFPLFTPKQSLFLPILFLPLYLFFSHFSFAHPITAEETITFTNCIASPDNGTTVFNTADSSAITDAIAAASPNGTVKIGGICQGVSTINGATQSIYIDKNLSIHGGFTLTNWNTPGAETTVDALYLGRVVYIPTGITASLENLKLIHGSGNGVTHYGDYLEIRKTTIMSNSTNSTGGGVSSWGNLLISESTISNNYAQSGGGIVHIYGFSATIISSTISGNSVGNVGAGIYNYGNMVITGSLIKDNISSGTRSGGMMNSGDAIITNSTFDNNQSFRGGGLYNQRDTTLIDVTFTNNSASEGGAIYNHKYLTVTHSALISNSANYGGGIYNLVRAELTNSTLGENYASNSGSAFYNNQGIAILRSNTIHNNQQPADGSAVYTFFSDMTLSENIIAGNGPIDCQANWSTIVSQGYNWVENDQCNINSSTDVRNQPADLHPLAYNNGLTLNYLPKETAPLVDRIPPYHLRCYPESQTDQRGFERRSQKGCDIGAIEINEISCWATADGGTTVFSSGNESALYDAVSVANDKDLVQVAGYCPGGRLIDDEFHTLFLTKSLTIQGGYTHTNWLLPPDSDNHPTVLDALIMGRVIYLAETTDTILSHLTLINGYLYDSDGAAIYHNGTNLTARNLTITENKIVGLGAGGAIWNKNILTLLDSKIYQNEAPEGGGLYTSGLTVIARTEWTNNSATDSGGGGAILNSGELSIKDSILANNQSTIGNGGAIANQNQLTLHHSSLLGNRALVGHGGGITNRGIAQIYNNTFHNNQSVRGALLSNDGVGVATLHHNTAAFNNASTEAGAFYLFSGIINLSNNILHFNFPENCSAGMNSLGYNLESGDSCNFTAPGDLTNRDALLGPLISSTAFPPFFIPIAESPAIDAGSCAISTINNDQRYDARPKGGACDIGSIELNLITCWATPDNGGTIFNSLDHTAIQDAIDIANDGDTIKVSGICLGTTPFNGSNQTLYIGKSITVTGGFSSTNWSNYNLAAPTQLNADQTGRLAYIEANKNVTLQNLYLINGLADNGGGIYNKGNLTLLNINLGHNATLESTQGNKGRGGGLYSEGVLTVRDSTIHHNYAVDSGGGFFLKKTKEGNEASISGSLFLKNHAVNDGGGIFNTAVNLTIINSTFSENTARESGGAISNDKGKNSVVTIKNSTLAFNSALNSQSLDNTSSGKIYLYDTILAPSDGVNCTSPKNITSFGYNLDEDGSCNLSNPTDISSISAGLGELDYFGGVTKLYELIDSSPAVDTGSCSNNTISTDQRSFSRPQGLGCDIGAYEQCVPPNNPTNLVGSLLMEDLLLNWVGSSYSYLIYRNDAPYFIPTDIQPYNSIKMTSYLDIAAVETATAQYYQIVAVANCGAESIPSSEVGLFSYPIITTP